jgi:hypothetical protein
MNGKMVLLGLAVGSTTVGSGLIIYGKQVFAYCSLCMNCVTDRWGLSG